MFAGNRAEYIDAGGAATLQSKTKARAKRQAPTKGGGTKLRMLSIPSPRKDAWLFPNHLARSSLFAPVERGAREIHQRTKLASRSDATIYYTGEQLDQADADILMEVIRLSSTKPLGTYVAVKLGPLLQKTGRNPSGANREWVKQRIRALSTATVEITVRHVEERRTKYAITRKRPFRLLSVRWRKSSKVPMIALDRRWSLLFSNKEYAIVNMERRRRLKTTQAIMPQNDQLAKALQLFFCTQKARAQRHRLDKLHRAFDRRSPLPKFRKALQRAASVLVAANELQSFNIEASSESDEKNDPGVLAIMRAR